MQTMATSDRTALLVRVAFALANGIPILVTLTLAATSKSGGGPVLSFVVVLLFLYPIAKYVLKVRGLRRSIVSGAIIGALTAWWVVINGSALRNIDDGLEMVYPIFALVLQNLVVALAIGGPPIPPRPDIERSELPGQ